MNAPSVYKVDNEALASAINKANRRLVYMAPGVYMPVAEEINKAWDRIGVTKVQIILDVNPEVFRLGYGEMEALTFLEKKAREKSTLLSQQPGVRIGLLIADEEIIIYTPTPLLIEGDTNENNQPIPANGQKKPNQSNQHLEANRPNAIRLESLPPNVAKDMGLGPQGVVEQNIGLEKAPSQKVEQVRQDLQANPPQKFNVAKTMNVFNSFFEFVDFELKNCFITRKEVPLKPDLFGLVKGDKAYENLKSSFKLVGKNSKISEKDLMDKRKKIADRYLISIKGYGSVIMRTRKEAFEVEMEELKNDVKKFQESIEKKLEEEITKNKKTLIAALLPAVKRKPPERWLKYFSSTDKKERDREIEQMLELEITKAFGEAKKLIDEMSVSYVPKGITYQLLNDKKFVGAAKKALPTMKTLHWEKTGIVSETEKPKQKEINFA